MYLEVNIGMALTWSIGLYGNYKFSPNSPVNIPLMPSKLTDSHTACAARQPSVTTLLIFTEHICMTSYKICH